jgi:hypothetical protein
MNLYCNIFNQEEDILNKIKQIYESCNINKALFIIKPALYKNIFKKLYEAEYPVCTSKDFNRFQNHNSRILLIKDIEFPDINNLEYSYYFKEQISLILFIYTSKFANNNIYQDLLLSNDIQNININEI